VSIVAAPVASPPATALKNAVVEPVTLELEPAEYISEFTTQ